MEADAEAIRAAVLLDEIMQAAPEHSTARIVVVRLPPSQAHTGSACFAALAWPGSANLTRASELFHRSTECFLWHILHLHESNCSCTFIAGMSCSQILHSHLQTTYCKWGVCMAARKSSTSSDLLSHLTPTPDSMLCALTRWSACKLEPAGEPCAWHTEPL